MIQDHESRWFSDLPSSRPINPPPISQMGAKTPPPAQGNAGNTGANPGGNQGAPAALAPPPMDDVDLAGTPESEALYGADAALAEHLQKHPRPAPDDGDPGPVAQRPRLGDRARPSGHQA